MVPMLFAKPGTERGGRERTKRCRHSSAGLWGVWGAWCRHWWEAKEHDSSLQRLCVNKANSASVWVCIVWLCRSYCDPCYSGILQNRTNSHKSFAEQINTTLQHWRWGEEESFKQLGWATQRFGSRRGRQLRRAPKAPSSAACHSTGTGSSERGPGRGHCGTTSIC